jgi:hypothetical protein
VVKKNSHKKAEVSVFPEKRFWKSVENLEKGFRSVKSCQTPPSPTPAPYRCVKHIQKAQNQA